MSGNSSNPSGVSPGALSDTVTEDWTPNQRPWESADPWFSAYTRQVIQTALKCYVRQLLIFGGIPGNIISCVVFFKHGLSDRINLLLFWLAVADLSHLLSQLMLMPDCYLTDPVDLASWEVITNRKTAYTALWTNYVSSTLMVVVSVDRCLSVTTPLKARRLLTYRWMVVATVLSYLVPLVMCLPVFLAFSIQWTVDPQTNRTMAYLDHTAWFPVDSSVAIDFMYRFPVIAKPIFLVTMIVCSIVTIQNLRRASSVRQQLTGKMKDTTIADRRITKMLLFLCLVYIFLVFPEVCVNITANFVSEFRALRKYHNTFIIVNQFVWIASCANSAVNFFAYLVLSARFRKSCVELCCCCERKSTKYMTHNTGMSA